MPNMKSAAKRMRSDAKKRDRNNETLSELKTLYKKFTIQVKESPAQAKESGRSLISNFDKAVSRNIIPHGRADRKKARIALMLQKISK